MQLNNSQSQLNHGLNPTRGLPNPTYYAKALLGEFSNYAFCEERSPGYKSQWRSQVFNQGQDFPVDLEIGTGNGYHFAHYAMTNSSRGFVGLELKYKPLIQSIRRALNGGAKNARICRYNARLLNHLFDVEEINNVIIHHPDPWPRERDWKKRLIQDSFLRDLYAIQRPNSTVEFKTDDLPYFEWSIEKFKNSPYKLTAMTYDLHKSEFFNTNFITSFENIFLKKGQPIFFAKLLKN